MQKTIFKILTLTQWEDFQSKGVFCGSADDKRDGFIHLSGAAQVQGTLDKHYCSEKTGGADIIVAAVNADTLGSDLKYERSRGGALFPHLFSDLPQSALTRHWVLSIGEDGRYSAGEAKLLSNSNLIPKDIE